MRNEMEQDASVRSVAVSGVSEWDGTVREVRGRQACTGAVA